MVDKHLLNTQGYLLMTARFGICIDSSCQAHAWQASFRLGVVQFGYNTMEKHKNGPTGTLGVYRCGVDYCWFAVCALKSRFLFIILASRSQASNFILFFAKLHVTKAEGP